MSDGENGAHIEGDCILRTSTHSPFQNVEKFYQIWSEFTSDQIKKMSHQKNLAN